jgi:hypothetical protein
MMSCQKEIDNQMKSNKSTFSQSSSLQIMKSLDSIDQDLDIEDLLNTSSYIFTARHRSIDSYSLLKPKTVMQRNPLTEIGIMSQIRGPNSLN